MSLLTPAPHPTASPSEALRRGLEQGLHRARVRGSRVLVSVVEPLPATDPLAAYAAAPEGVERVFWQHHDQLAPNAPRQAVAGIGAAHTITAQGGSRFQAVAAGWQDLLDSALITAPHDGERAWGAGPLLLGGFSFDPLRPHTATWETFPDALFTLPRFTIAESDEGSWLTTNVLLSPQHDLETVAQQTLRQRAALLHRMSHAIVAAPAAGAASALEDMLPADAWQDIVGRAARDVREGSFAKLVLARQARVTAPDVPFDAAQTMVRLRAANPGSFLFAFSHPGEAGERTFLGATPERLLRLRDRTVETSSLAGSIRRGATAEEDAELGNALLASTKDRTEHAVVADMLREALAPVCRELSIPAGPALLRLSNVQHLFTPIRGVLSNGQTILDLVERLHPTPAVGGFPQRVALETIREREWLDRGWYAAPVGWLDRRGEGEFAVAIRSALLDSARHEALLFAGCGIVGDSDPAAEYAESRLKMQAILSALG
jgi:isochorismate synthase